MNQTLAKKPVLKATDLKHSFSAGGMQTEVLRGVSLEVESGQVCAIVGPSGCGKSTLLYLLGLLDRPDSGEIMLEDRLVSQASDMERTAMRNAYLGFVFQFHFLIRELTAMENVSLPLRKAGKTTKEANRRSEQLLADLDIADKRHRPANKLSGGEQQRVAVARALSTSPSVILADEPTGNLDTANSEKVFELLSKAAREEGPAILLVTHNQDLAARADRRLRMLDGRFET